MTGRGGGAGGHNMQAGKQYLPLRPLTIGRLEVNIMPVIVVPVSHLQTARECGTFERSPALPGITPCLPLMLPGKTSHQ